MDKEIENQINEAFGFALKIPTLDEVKEMAELDPLFFKNIKKEKMM